MWMFVAEAIMLLLIFTLLDPSMMMHLELQWWIDEERI